MATSPVATTMLDSVYHNYSFPFAFKLGRDYTTQEEQLRHLFALNRDESNDGPGVDINNQSYQTLINDLLKNNNVTTKHCMFDTSVGGMDCINARWGFNRDDDIIQPLQAKGGKPEFGGVGRVYAENYWDNHQLLNITVGVPEFTSLVGFYMNCIDKDVADDVNSGRSINIARSIGTAIGTLLGFSPLLLPVTIYRYVKKVVDLLDPSMKITRYYDLRPTMPLYYRYVNSILVHLATNMGFYKGTLWFDDEGGSGSGGQTGGTLSNSLHKIYGSSNNNNEMDPATLPEFLKRGPSVFKILAKKDIEQGLLEGLEGDSDKYLRQATDAYDDQGFWSAFTSIATATATGATKFISFRINKSVDSSESLTNSTGPSSIASLLNSAAQKGKDTTFSLFNGKFMDSQIGKVLGSLGDIVSGTLNTLSLGATGVAATILTGNGYVDIPDIWLSSSFTKSYNFSFQLRAPYGDNLSVLQGLYYPLSFILPLACPRSVGDNAYTSPFLIRAYCKGMFAIPLGIIDSMTITRGAAEFGWNHARLPTVINVSFSIKDLSPIMHIALSDSAKLGGWSNSTAFEEYLLTLSGMGLNERLLWSSRVSRRIQTFVNMRKTTWWNPAAYVGQIASELLPFRIYGIFTSSSTLGNN